MRYRDLNSLADISVDAACVVDFIGREEYYAAMERIRRSLHLKGYVTSFDELAFRLELELLNVEILRRQSSGVFQSLPPGCHQGVDFLIGLGQTIPILSATAKARLLGRIRKGLQEGLWPLHNELSVAAGLSQLGWSIYFHDLEEGGGYDFLATKNELRFEVEAKSISHFTGWPVKPENVNKLLVEIKRGFEWRDDSTIPLLRLALPADLLPERAQLQVFVNGLNEVARTRGELLLANAKLAFIGTIPTMEREKVTRAADLHSERTGSIVITNLTPPRLMLQIDSERPIQLGRKIIKTISEAARDQFSHLNPGIISAHLQFVSKEVFGRLSRPPDNTVSFLDQIADATLISTKRSHLSQLVFSGGSFHDTTTNPPFARSAHLSAIYNSPICRFGQNVLYPGGRKRSFTAPVRT